MTVTDTPAAARQSDDPIEELTAWLHENWDPDLTVAEWWERLGTAGWSAPLLPVGSYGKGLNRNDAVRVQQTIAEFGALAAPGGLGLLLAAPTIATHGTPEQVEEYVRPIVTGQQAWCQLFSEPGAGSDLAGLNARAIKDGEEWIVNGQKVWTSGGQYADMGMLIARTDPDVPKHQGISYFAISMHQEGMDVRPLREITGHAMFNEVFMSDARTTDAALIGGLNNGWAVANTTLMFERSGLGAGGGSAGASTAIPGTVAGNLDKRAGDFIVQRDRPRAQGAGADPTRRGGGLIPGVAKAKGLTDDPIIRQQLAKLHTMNEIARFSNLRSKALRKAGMPDIPGIANISKLAMSDLVRAQRDLGLALVGAEGMLHAYTGEQRKVLDDAVANPVLGMITESALYAQAPPIYGGTDQIQKNIIGERVLGLPKEPNNDRVTAYRDLPKNG